MFQICFRCPPNVLNSYPPFSKVSLVNCSNMGLFATQNTILHFLQPLVFSFSGRRVRTMSFCESPPFSKASLVNCSNMGLFATQNRILLFLQPPLVFSLPGLRHISLYDNLNILYREKINGIFFL